MISDFAKDELTDAAFSIYYFIGLYLRTHFWTLIVGYVMERYGFTASILCRCVHLYCGNAPPDAGERRRRKKRKGLMHRRGNVKKGMSP